MGGQDNNLKQQENKEKQMAKGTKVKTLSGPLTYVYIKGKGRNGAMPGEEPRMQFMASMVVPENGEIHKDFQKKIAVEWDAYKKQYNVKGLPKTNGIKLETEKDPNGEIDLDTEEVKRIPTGNVLITFKTNTVWPDNSPQVVKVYNGKGKDITKIATEAKWSIGTGSEGIIHGSANANSIGGKHKVSLYLTAVQLATLLKYEGEEADTEEIEGADDLDLDLGDIDTGSSEHYDTEVGLPPV